MLIPVILKRRDAASIMLAIALGLAFYTVVSSISGAIMDMFGLNTITSFGYVDADSALSTIIKALLLFIVQVALIEGFIRLYVAVAGNWTLTRKHDQ